MLAHPKVATGLSGVKIVDDAHKNGVTDDDIGHAIEHAIRVHAMTAPSSWSAPAATDNCWRSATTRPRTVSSTPCPSDPDTCDKW